MQGHLSPFHFAFEHQTTLPHIVSRITRADMGLVLPRLDTPVVDTSGNTDPVKKKELEGLIERYKAVYAVLGRVSSHKLTKGKQDKDGVRFVGQFKAIVNPLVANKNVGTYFASGRCHVPTFYEEQLYTQLIDAQRDDPKTMLEFFVGIGLKAPNPTKPSITGYEWTVEPLVDMSTADDPLDLLMTRGRARLAGPGGAAPQAESAATAPPAAPPVENSRARRAG